jgi:hypothetical protein
MFDLPLDALRASSLWRHAMGEVPNPVQGQILDPKLPRLPYIALTTFSVTFLASPSSIMVLSR